jgi:hypothetical protein
MTQDIKTIYEDISYDIKKAIPQIAKNIHEAFGQGFGQRFSALGSELKNRAKASYEQMKTSTQRRKFDDSERIKNILLTHHVTSNLGISPGYYSKVMNTYPKVQPTAPSPISANASAARQQAHAEAMRRYLENRSLWNERQSLLNKQNELFRDMPTLGRFAIGATKHSQRARTKEVLGRWKATRADRNVNPAYAAEVLNRFRQMKKSQRRAQAATDYANLHPTIGRFLSRVETLI